MKVQSLVACIIFLCLIGCSPKDSEKDQASRLLSTACPLYIRTVEDDGKLAPYPFIRPEHVASILPAKPLHKGEMALWVELTETGADIMLTKTKHSVGSKIAIFCGKEELNRPNINGPVAKSFRVFVSDKGGT